MTGNNKGTYHFLIGPNEYEDVISETVLASSMWNQFTCITSAESVVYELLQFK